MSRGHPLNEGSYNLWQQKPSRDGEKSQRWCENEEMKTLTHKKKWHINIISWSKGEIQYDQATQVFICRWMKIKFTRGDCDP